MTKRMTLHDLFHQELRDIYDAERQLTKALPKIIKHATSDVLTTALEDHLAATENQIMQLERVFKMIDATPRGKKCAGMEGLLEEGSEFLKTPCDESVKDAGIIAAAQRVEHYEIAVYGTLATYARELGLDEAALLLEDILAEEKDADELLTACAQSINFAAVTAGE